MNTEDTLIFDPLLKSFWLVATISNLFRLFINVVANVYIRPLHWRSERMRIHKVTYYTWIIKYETFNRILLLVIYKRFKYLMKSIISARLNWLNFYRNFHESKIDVSGRTQVKEGPIKIELSLCCYVFWILNQCKPWQQTDVIEGSWTLFWKKRIINLSVCFEVINQHSMCTIN